VPYCNGADLADEGLLELTREETTTLAVTATVLCLIALQA